METVLQGKTKSLEVIVVDNGSTDGTVDYLNQKYHQLKQDGKFLCVALDKNYGPAKARNIGVKNSQGKYLGFLDNDTEVDKNWADEAVKVFNSDKRIGIVQCKLLLNQERSKLDYVGEYLGQNGFLVQRCQDGEIDRGQYDQQVEILAAKSAGMFISRVAFEAVGGFDEDYFIYVEETDLGWRCWLAGYKAVYAHKSMVYHEFGTSTLSLGQQKKSYQAKFHGCKNYILSLTKNLELINLGKILPVHVFLWWGLAWYSLIFSRNWQSWWWIHKAIFWNLINLSSTRQKRSLIQSKRQLSDQQLFDKILKKKSWSYFLDKARDTRQVGHAQGFDQG